MTRRRITLDTVPTGSVIALDDGLGHYLGRVLRLATGEEIDVVDADGGRWRGRVAFSSAGASVTDLQRVAEPDAPEDVMVIASLIKQVPWEWMLQKATELGATEIVPFAAERSVVRVEPSKAAAKQVRWQRICDSAVRQSERSHRVRVAAPTTLATALADARERGLRLVFFDETRPETPWPPGVLDGPIAFVTGPEGGFVDAERRALVAAGAVGVGLGPALLKAETATIAALAHARLVRSGLAG